MPTIMAPASRPPATVALRGEHREVLDGAECLQHRGLHAGVPLLHLRQLAYRRSMRRAAELSGRDVDVVHLVGGGARNALLCQLTADACGLPVIAGPVEAAAYGNVLVQARALGAVDGGLAELRRVVHASEQLRRFEPNGNDAAWAEATKRLEG